MPHALSRISVAATLLLAAALAPAVAAAEGLNGFYAGGGAGRADNDYDGTRFESALSTLATNGGQTVTFSDAVLRKRSNAWFAYAGYMRWSTIGIEALYLHLGELTYWSSGALTPPAQTLDDTTTVRSRGPALAFVFRLPLAESLDLNLRVGDYYGKTTLLNTYLINGQLTSATASSSASSLLLGLGAAYTFDGHWSVRLDYLRVNQAGDSTTVGRYSVNLASLGASYTF